MPLDTALEPLFDPALLHISVRSQRRDGRAVDTPVWFLARGDRLYFRTIATSPKVARIRANPAVAVAACTAEGALLGPFSAARAQVVVADHPMLAAIDAQLDRKYGDERRAMTELMAQQAQPLLYVEITF